MQAPDIAWADPGSDDDDGKVVMVVEIHTKRGVHFDDVPRRLEAVILADYIKREGAIPPDELEEVEEMLAYDAHEALDEGGFLKLMDPLLYDDGDYIVVDAGEGMMTYCLENDSVFLAGPATLN